MTTRRVIRQRSRHGPRSAAPLNLVAEFADLSSAQKAIDALGLRGIEGAKISMAGEAAEEAAGKADTRDVDTGFIKLWFRWWFYGGLIGAVIGALIGIPLGLLVLSLAGLGVSLGHMIVAVLLSALGFGISGAMIAQYYPVHGSQGWGLGFAETEAQRVFVEVQSEREAEIDTAGHILESKGAVRLRRPDHR